MTNQNANKEMDPIKHKLYIDAHQAMVDQFEAEIAEYEANGPIKWEAD